MKVLIVDDEKNIRESIQRLLEFEEIESIAAKNGEIGREKLLEQVFDAVIVDLKMPGMSGQELLTWMREEGIPAPVLMISAHGEIEDAVKALKSGARDYLVKPFDPTELVFRLKKVIADRRREALLEVGKRTAAGTVKLIGKSPGISSIREQIARIAATRSTVLITGESGTGKEVVAREIHNAAPNSAEPFVAVNIGGLPESLIESELFGHEKGAFTGAAARKTGLFELAGEGTLFLDEIGEMPVAMQVRLLRVLQERKIRRLGGTLDIPVEARILSATNRDIEAQVRSGTFREDLFYRLNVVRITVPPLRERMEDLPLLSGFLLQKVSQRMGLNGIELGQDALERLSVYHFPGNVRELENILERALIYRKGNLISAADIDIRSVTREEEARPAGQTEDVQHADREVDQETPPPKGENARPRSSSENLKTVEREAILRALRRWDGNRTKAAEELGISRRTIIYKIKQYSIDE